MKYTAQVWIVEGKLYGWEIYWIKPTKEWNLPGKYFEQKFDTWNEAREWIRDFEVCSYIWKIGASMAACNALMEYHKLMNNVILQNAEKLALDRSEIDGYEPAIRLEDVVNSINLYSDVNVGEVL